MLTHHSCVGKQNQAGQTNTYDQILTSAIDPTYARAKDCSAA
jgi:hypothetical protein